tara:strand:- start:10238 stop:10975 length:738 start_codon:yes stop_codon:yes gene_type:complete
MNEKLKQDLQALTCQGNTVLLPKTPLRDYAGLKKALLQAQGKYKRNIFEFPFPSKVVINKLLSGEVINWKIRTQFFETPEPMAEYMVNQIAGKHEGTVEMLEPEAGHGALIRAALKSRPNLNVTAVEKDELNFSILQDLYPNQNLIHADFLTHDFKGKKFDLIIANPPFSKNQDIDHVLKMWDLLAKDGQLFTIMSTSWTFGTQKKQVAFREWLEDECGLITENGQGTFKTSGTMVQTVLVELTK